MDTSAKNRLNQVIKFFFRRGHVNIVTFAECGRGAFGLNAKTYL